MVRVLAATAVVVTAGLFAACTAAPQSGQEQTTAAASAAATAAASADPTVAPSGEPAETAAPLPTEGAEATSTESPEVTEPEAAPEGTGSSAPEPAKSFREPAPIAKGAVNVSVLGDSTVAAEDSWFRQTISANMISGVRPGAVTAEPGATAAALESKLDDAAAAKGLVIVQAGTNDIAAGAGPDATANNVKKLLEGIKERGAVPVLALIPPSASRGPDVRAANRLLSEYAADQGIRVLDLTSGVAGTEGQWRPGLSDDGVHPNAAGAKNMADAAKEQLPTLLQ